MAITRLGQAGAETRTEAVELSTVGNAAVSSVEKRSGSYAFRFTVNGQNGAGWSCSTSQFRVGGGIRHNGKSVLGVAYVWSWLSGSSEIGRLRYDGSSLILTVAGSQVASVDAGLAGFTQGQWIHLGIDAKIASSGWIKVYIDGVNVLSYTGDTRGAGGVSTVTSVLFGGGTVNAWASYVYFDDCYLDDTTGETAPACPPDLAFLLVVPNGNGYSSQWTGSDGDQNDNYALVSETPHDSDASYVKATAAGLIDAYDLGTITIPSGREVTAVIPLAVARKTLAEDDVKLKVRIRSGSSESSMDAQALATSYGLAIWDRETLNPADGQPWEQADIDDMQVVIESAGAFA